MLVLVSTATLVVAGPAMARQLNHSSTPEVVMPSGDAVMTDQDVVTTVDAHGTNTTVYRTRHRVHRNDGVSGYSTGSAATDAFTGALLGNVIGGIVSDQIGGRVKQNKQFQSRFPDPLPPPPSPPAANIGDLVPTPNQ